ncbi:MAG: hypothetical protein NTY22_05815 [Proteobacteria bacterium]|nr:hypothetical protein [Pseudomonadota bacterium]
MKKMTVLVLLMCFTGCASQKILLRNLDKTITEAAENSKKAGAKELTLELTVVAGWAVAVNPSVLTTNINSSQTTHLTVKIDNLKDWKPRPATCIEKPGKTKSFGMLETAESAESEYYTLDTKTFQMTPTTILKK